MKIAIPTDAPGGLEAMRSGHFGHCDMFTILDLSEENQVVDAHTIINEGHEAGGCIAPVTILQQAGVDAIIVAGLGKRPMEGFNQAGITVYYADPNQAKDVAGIIELVQRGGLIVMNANQACQGSANCQH